MAALLEVKGLKTQFFTQDGVVHAVNGISITCMRGKRLRLLEKAAVGKASA